MGSSGTTQSLAADAFITRFLGSLITWELLPETSAIWLGVINPEGMLMCYSCRDFPHLDGWF